MIQIFVYGTLKPGEAYYERYCKPHVETAIAAWVRGQLYHLPQGYPAVTVGDGWVSGALLHLRDESALAALDRFEDYDPAQPPEANEYTRHCLPVFDSDRAPLGHAWVYLMAVERVQHYGGILIPDGIWSRAQWHSIAPDSPYHRSR